MTISFEPILILVLFICSGIFSGSEIAFVWLSQAKVRALKKIKRRNAQFVVKLKATPQQFLITILIGNNLVNIGASVFSTVWVTEQFGSQWLGLVTGVLTLLVLIFGEIIPKNYAQLHAERFALVTAPWIYFLQKSLFPVVWMLNKLSEYAVVFLGRGKTTTSAVTEEELVAMVSISAESGAIEKGEKEMIQAVLELDDTHVGGIKKSPKEIVSISADQTLEDIIQLFIDSYHSRILVFGKDPYDIMGILHIKDCLKYLQKYSGDCLLKDLNMIEPVFVPETKRINELFKELQRTQMHLAIVVDEYGAVKGLVTIEDILEEVFGEIQDEHEKVEDDIEIHQINENTWLADGDTVIKKMRMELGEFLPRFNPSRTLAHIFLEHFQKIPKPGDSVKLGGYHFFVEKMEKHRIVMVKIRKMNPS